MAAGPPRKIQQNEASRIAAALARAFEHDPMSSHLLPDSDSRRSRLERAFRLFLNHLYVPDGSSYTIGEADGAALWLAPGAYPPRPTKQLRLLPGLARVFGLRPLPRALRDLGQMESIHPKRGPHWYLGFLGVDPSKQGRGLGSGLLKPVLERCDSDRLPAYLETSNPANLPLYQRHGFDVIAECDITAGPHIWGMWREPQA